MLQKEKIEEDFPILCLIGFSSFLDKQGLRLATAMRVFVTSCNGMKYLCLFIVEETK